jgi:regulatory Fis family protein
MSLPAVTQLPQTDHLRIQALIRSLASGMIVPIELAERAYRLGNESCHRAMDDLTESLPEEPLDLSEVERITINKALAKCRGDKLQAARMLGIGKTTLYRKVAAYGIQPAHTLVCPSCGRKIKYPRRPSRSSDEPQANPLSPLAAESAISAG